VSTTPTIFSAVPEIQNAEKHGPDQPDHDAGGILCGDLWFVSDKLGVDDRKFGLQASFVLSLTLLAMAVALVLVALPARPRPRDADLEASDRPAR